MGPHFTGLLFTRSTDGKQFDVAAVHVSGKQIMSLIATDDDEREGSWLR